MSLPKRYSIRGFSAALVEEDNGVMVKYSDYELLRQEFSLLAEERHTTIRALELENELLRKITDTIKLLHTFGLDVNAELDKAKSEAAKETRP
jgi:hypothetical protein